MGCNIHNGFGLHEFKEQLAGPEYAQRFVDKFREYGIEYKVDTMVLGVNEDKTIIYSNDKIEKEPTPLLVKLSLGGVGSVIVTLVMIQKEGRN